MRLGKNHILIAPYEQPYCLSMRASQNQTCIALPNQNVNANKTKSHLHSNTKSKCQCEQDKITPAQHSVVLVAHFFSGIEQSRFLKF